MHSSITWLQVPWAFRAPLQFASGVQEPKFVLLESKTERHLKLGPMVSSTSSVHSLPTISSQFTVPASAGGPAATIPAATAAHTKSSDPKFDTASHRPGQRRDRAAPRSSGGSKAIPSAGSIVASVGFDKKPIVPFLALTASARL
jgi:hypothetical protein